METTLETILYYYLIIIECTVGGDHLHLELLMYQNEIRGHILVV